MRIKSYIKGHPATAFFVLTFFLSWLGAFLLVAPVLLKGEAIPSLDGILLFPILLLGPPAASVILSAITGGRHALQDLWHRMRKWRAPIKWYAIPAMIFPCLILATLLILRYLVSPTFTPNLFVLGFLFGIPAGILEEIGWTGFAIPALLRRRGLFKSALLLGMIWALWHLPVLDFLGAARPHGSYLLPFFFSFGAILAAVRMLIVWIYAHTGSIPLAQWTHALSTGCLVIFGPANVSPGQETGWYALYAVFLWMAVLLIVHLTRSDSTPLSGG
jgi:membrane protease YdiL (CAAX protease family)